MEDMHKDWLNGNETDTLGSENITALMAAAIGASPYASVTAYDPESELAAMLTGLSDFDTVIDGIDGDGDWENAITAVQTKLEADVFEDVTSFIVSPNTTYIDNDVDAFADKLDNQIESTVLPRFQAGMRDINAVISSAFVIGEALIEEGRDAEVAKHASGLRMTAMEIDSRNNELLLKDELHKREMIKSEGSRVLDLDMAKVEYEKAYLMALAEIRRMRIVAYKEEHDMNVSLDKRDSLWDLEVFQ
ncbi:MAG: hypothetical protein DRP09_17710, partial [Candidatus Thorarchaeota archaeon]